MQNYRTEYRINKKGAECFRTEAFSEAKDKLSELSKKRPGIYTMQYRDCRTNKYGVLDELMPGRPSWSCWKNM